MADELKPCPFACVGGTVLPIDRHGRPTYARCSVCGIFARIELWNCRAPSHSPARAALEASVRDAACAEVERMDRVGALAELSLTAPGTLEDHAAWDEAQQAIKARIVAVRALLQHRAIAAGEEKHGTV